MCKGTTFKTVIDFGQNALVNSLIDKKDLDGEESTFPLVVEQCQDCQLVQIVDIVSAQGIYKDVDYLYFSGDMPNLKEYFDVYAQDLKERFIDEGDLVLEIGSNDGTMLELMMSKAVGLGVDPASNVVTRALRRGIPTISDFFTERLAKSILREWGNPKVIYANNCIAHLDSLRDLMYGVDGLLHRDGVFVVECNYWGGMVKNKNYSLIYHDHFSYFSLKNWIDFAPEFGLQVFDATVTPAQGGSLRVFMDRGNRELTQRYDKLLDEEIKTDLNSYKTCQTYKKDVLAEAKKLGNLIRELVEDGKVIAGYGAAAKGFSILKLADIDDRHIKFFVDDSPAKQGKYTPVSHIPVVARDQVLQEPDYFFITAPNYEDVIVAKETNFKEKGGKFITADCRII